MTSPAGTTHPWLRGPERPLIIGHRGARHAAVENTLVAFELARNEGADGVEFDVQCSKDRRTVVFHDEDLSRMTDGARTERVAELTALELQQLPLRQGARAPLLSEVLDWARTTGQLLNLELKTYSPNDDPLPDLVAEELRAVPDLHPQLIVSCFHPQLLYRFHEALTEVRIGVLFESQHAALRHQPELAALGDYALHPEALWLLQNPPDVHDPRPMNTWTVNDPSWARTLAPKVNSLITDNPALIAAAL